MLIVPAVAAAALGLIPGLDGLSASRSKQSEVRLDRLSPAELRAGMRGQKRAPGSRPSAVQFVGPVGRSEEAVEGGGREGPPARVLRDNARIREDLRTLRALAAERERVSSALSRASASFEGPLRLGPGGLAWPVNGPVSSPFGQRWGRLHAGVDIPAPVGTPIRAAASGRVALAGSQGGYGNYTCIQHTRALSSCYAHQSRFATSTGDSVRRGEVIGFVGSTGRSFGPHLHFETWVGGRPVDPMRYF